MKRLAVAVVVLAALVIPAAAQSDVVNEFNFQLKDVKSYGAYTVVFSSRSYDTTGAVPPALIENYFRLPKGAVLRKEFLKKRFLCNVEELKFIRKPSTCRHAQIGRGRVQVDARRVVDENGVAYLQDLVPADIYLFLGKGKSKRAIASFVILGIPDASAPIVAANPNVRDTRAILQADLFNEPTPDGRFQYKLVLPVGPVSGFDISVAEVKVVTKGLTHTKVKRRCSKRRGGRCVKRKVKRTKLFWFTRPTCPPSGTLPFESVYGYRGFPTQTLQIAIPCPDFG